MSEHRVLCAKLHQELPGLDEPPFDTALGQKIYENVSQQAWNQWTEFCKMLSLSRWSSISLVKGRRLRLITSRRNRSTSRRLFPAFAHQGSKSKYKAGGD